MSLKYLPSRRLGLHAVVLACALGLSLSACGGSDDDPAPNDSTSSGATDTSGSEGASACYVRLFDSDHFDEDDDNIRIDGPDEFADLSNLPGADGKDWNDEADSLIYSAGATVTVWTETEFQGDKLVLDAADSDQKVNDDSHPDYEEPSSLKIECADE